MREHHKRHGHHKEFEHILHKALPLKGILHLLILKIIKRGPVHGSEIHKILRERYNVEVPKPLVYTLLRRMERKQLIDSYWKTAESGPVKRVYVITDKGRDYLDFSVKRLKEAKELIDELCSED